MADNEYKIKIVVTDNGGTKLAEKNISGLGAAVDRVGKSHKAASKETGDFYDTQKKGIIGTANSTKSFSKLAESIGGQSSGLVGAYATLAANIFAVSAAFNALRGASQVEQIFKGLEAAGIRTGRSLTSTAQALKEVTGNAISTEQALRSTAQITAAGFGDEAVKRLGQAARDTSFALGRNMTDSLDRLSRGVVKLEPELLDELGIMTKLTESNTLYAAKLGKTETQLTNFEKRQGFLNAVLAEAELKFGGLSAAAGDSTAYDKLASKFTDLTNTILNGVNALAKPLAGVLANSATLILGLMISFAASLKNQLVPALAGSAAAANKQALALKALALEKRAAIEAARALAVAESRQALASKMNFNFIGNSGPKAYMAVADSVRNGTATLKEQQIALVSLQRSYRANDTILKSNAAYGPNTDKGKEKAAQNARIQQEMDGIRQLQAAQASANTADVEGTERVTKARLAAKIASREALAQTSAAASIGAASQLKLGESWKQLTLSVRAYASAQALAGNAGILSLGGIRTAAFAASTGVRVLGVAFLTVLPYLGLIITAIGLVQSALEGLKSDQTKKVEKAFDDLTESTSKTNEYLKELNRINTSSAPIALRTAQAITIQSNAIDQVAEKYEALIEASGGLSKSSSAVEKFLNSFGASLKGSLNIDGQEIAQNTVNAFINNIDTSKKDLGIDKLFAGTIKAFDAISQEAPQATAEMIQFYGGMEKFSKLPIEAQEKAVRNIVLTVRERYGEAAQNVKELQEAFKALEQSIGDFTLSSVLGTKYDQVVKNFDAVSASINDFANAGVRAKDINWEKLLTGVGPGISKFLDESTQRQLDNFKIADSTVQSLKKQKEVLGDLNADDQARLDRNQRILANSGELFQNIESQVEGARALFINAQLMERTYKAQLELLNAHVQANQNLYQAAGAGVRARINQEEKIRNIQEAQIKSELRIQELAVTRQRARIQELRSLQTQSQLNARLIAQETERTEIALKNRLSATDASVGAIEAGALTGGAYLAAKGLNKENQETATLIENYRSFIEYRKESGKIAMDQAKELVSLNNSVRDSEAAIFNLKNQLAVLDQSRLTNEQKIAAIRAADVEFQSSLLSTLKEQRKTLRGVEDDYTQIDAIINGNSDSLKFQLTTIRTAANVEREASKASANIAKSKLQTEIATAKAGLTRKDLDASEIEAGKTQVKGLESQLAIQEQQADIDNRRITSQEQLNIAQKVYFDTAKEGLDWQQTSLDYANKELDARRALSDEAQKNYELRVKLDAKRKGFNVSDAAQEGIEIRAAAEAYKLAVQEVNIKKGLIDLEYALLDAQKDHLTEELRARRENLNSEDPRNATRIAQLNSTIDRLENLDLSQAAENAKKVVDLSIDNAALTLKTALERTVKDSVLGGVASAFSGIALRRRERQAGIEALQNSKPIGSAVNIVKADTEAQKDALAKEVTNPLVTSNNLLITEIEKWITTIEKTLGVSASRSGGNSIQDAAALAASKGFRISEMAGYGGVTSGVHTGAGHAQGRAFDLNIGTGNVEANNPAMRKRMDDMAAEFRAQGYKVLWLTEGHFNHMHVEITKAAAAAFTKVTQAVSTVANKAESKIAQELDASNPTDVVVTARKAANDNSLVDSLPDLTPKIPKDFSMIGDALDGYDALSSKVIENLRTLGPDGEIVASVIEGLGSIGNASLNAIETMSSATASSSDKIKAVAEVASAALSTIQSVVAASAASKEDAIQREINAEQKRDGKSAESVAKIAALEKKKDEIAKKAFNTNKKLMIAQAIISTAAGVAMALGTLPPPLSFIMAGITAALGAAQIAVIAGTQYQSTASSAASIAQPSQLTIGKRGDSVDLAKQNSNVGGELGYLRGKQGTGSNSGNYNVVGSAYGGDLWRGYGNSAYVVGEKGPETLTPQTPITVRPANDNNSSAPMSATINIHALDAGGVESILEKQKGNIITMLRKAANSNGESFMEDVNVNVYSRPNTANRL